MCGYITSLNLSIFFSKHLSLSIKKCPLNLDRVHIVSSCDQMKPLEIRDACVPKIG